LPESERGSPIPMPSSRPESKKIMSWLKASGSGSRVRFPATQNRLATRKPAHPALHPCPDGIPSKDPRRNSPYHFITEYLHTPPAPYGFNRFLELHRNFPGFCTTRFRHSVISLIPCPHTPDSLIFYQKANPARRKWQKI